MLLLLFRFQILCGRLGRPADGIWRNHIGLMDRHCEVTSWRLSVVVTEHDISDNPDKCSSQHSQKRVLNQIGDIFAISGRHWAA